MKAVTEVIDDVVVKRPNLSSFTKERRRKRKQHLCLDKAYNFKPVKQEIIKRGYVLHISNKRKRGERINKETKKISRCKKHPTARRCWVVERTNS
jgi:hypothetical protein